MGKGFNNYMCKKFFHPASRDNLKRVWMAEQKAAAEKQKQDELRIQYEKEQEVFNNKALVSKESKDKLSVNFMYEQPPGMKKENVKEEGEGEYKFEWQRKYNAPRESYCKDNTDIKDQPFGIPVRNVRCLKCRKWGHINTDKECPMFASFSGVEAGAQGSDTFSLMRQMREDGLQLKRSAVNTLDAEPVEIPQESFKGSDDSSCEENLGEEMEILKNLTYKQKKKLLKKIKKIEKERKRLKKEKDGKSKKQSRQRHDSDTDEDLEYSRRGKEEGSRKYKEERDERYKEHHRRDDRRDGRYEEDRRREKEERSGRHREENGRDKEDRRRRDKFEKERKRKYSDSE